MLAGGGWHEESLFGVGKNWGPKKIHRKFSVDFSFEFERIQCFFSGFHTWPVVFFSTFHLVIFRCQTNRGCFSTGSLRVFCFPINLDRYLKMMPKNRSWRYIFQLADHLDAIPLAQFPGFFFHQWELCQDRNFKESWAIGDFWASLLPEFHWTNGFSKRMGFAIGVCWRTLPGIWKKISKRVVSVEGIFGWKNLKLVW